MIMYVTLSAKMLFMRSRPRAERAGPSSQYPYATDHYLQVESFFGILAIVESMQQEGGKKNILLLNYVHTPRPAP